MLGSLLLHLFFAVATAQNDDTREGKGPIKLEKSGGFNIGGKVIESPTFAGMTLTCDHGYMEYFIPWTPRKTSIVMWHSSSTQVWQNRWDGGEGFKDKFLRRDYPVYLWEGPRVGRAGWSCEPFSYEPDYRDQGNFFAWNFGPADGEGEWWDDVSFPTENRDYHWEQARGSRYLEFDTVESVQLQSDAAATSADYGMSGDSVIYLTNSAAGLRAMVTAIKSNSTAIKGIVAYETVGVVYPEKTGYEPGDGGFGPVIVSDDDFKKLSELKEIQFIFGDHRNDSFSGIQQAREVAELINEDGGNASVLKLGEVDGLKGNTHIAFADMSNDKVAELLDEFLARNGLDEYD